MEGTGPSNPCSHLQQPSLREVDPYGSLSEQTPSGSLVSTPYQPKKLPRLYPPKSAHPGRARGGESETSPRPWLLASLL